MSMLKQEFSRRFAKIEGDLLKQGQNLSKASQVSLTQMSGDKTESKLVSQEDRLKDLESFKLLAELRLQGLDESLKETQFSSDSHELQL